MKNEINTYLLEIDQSSDPVSFHGEHKIAQEIRKILKADQSYTPNTEDIAEEMAFEFMPEYSDSNSGWGTYYGPILVAPDEKGQIVEYPNLSKVNDEVLNYWIKRANESKNPILVSRYADLVIDFYPKILKKNADVSLFEIAINAILIICSKSLADDLDCKTKIKRALILGLKINHQKKVSEIINAIISLEQKIAVDDKPGLWGFSFQWILLDFNKKIPLDEKMENFLVVDMEERLKRVESDLWLTKRTVSLLAEYYSNKKDEDNLIRVLSYLEKTLKSNIENAEPLLKMHGYEEMSQIYQRYKALGFEKAKDASDRFVREIGSLDLNWSKSLKKISVKEEIKQEDIDKFLISIFDQNQNDLESIVNKLVINFLLHKNEVEKQLTKVASKYPLQFLFTTSLVSEEGVLMAKINGLTEDYEKHFEQYASRYMQFGAGLLMIALDELKKRVNKKDLIDYFKNSTLFVNENSDYLERALSSYWDGDYLVSSHLFNPLIETAIRELVKNSGGVVLKPNEIGGYNLVTLGSFLQDNANGQGAILKDIFSKIDPDICFYFRLVLKSSLGMNLRDDFAHGIGKSKFFRREASDRLFHIMMCLSLIRSKDK